MRAWILASAVGLAALVACNDSLFTTCETPADCDVVQGEQCIDHDDAGIGMCWDPEDGDAGVNRGRSSSSSGSSGGASSGAMCNARQTSCMRLVGSVQCTNMECCVDLGTAPNGTPLGHACQAASNPSNNCCPP